MLEHLGRKEYTYSEVPPKESATLDGFLFDGKQGYCQQFSGAMALLLRMAGIPARVVTGFSTGATDTKTGEFIVRDFDAHSWVEVYYPGWGWYTFDPTPAASPARSQPADSASVPGSSTGSTQSFGGDPLAERGAGVPVAAESAPWWRIPAIVAGALAVARPARARRPPLAAWRAAGAVRARARAAAHAPRAGARDHAARARGPLRRRPPRPPATSAPCARAATATNRATRPARSDAACGPSSDEEAAFWADFVPGGPSRHGRPRPTIAGMDDVYDLYQRGMALLEDGHFHQATIPLAKARDLEPDKTSIREALGRAYFRSGGFEEARAEFEAVVEHAPTNDYALFCLGRALMMLGRDAEARKPLTLAVNMNPKRRDYRIYRDRARKAA